MLTPHAAHTATLLPDGRVLVAGGASDSGGRSSAELYDATTGKWAKTGSMKEGRSYAAATLLSDGRVLVVGGWNGDMPLASAELYDPAGGTWSTTGSMQATRSGHTATLLPDGKVLVAGGDDIEGAEAASVERMGRTTAELYDPRTGRWTTTGNMTGPRTEHTATLLPDGRVLVAGGDLSSDGQPAELYDPGSGRWTPTGQMADARARHTATLLLDGRVLVAGGFVGSALDNDRPCSPVPTSCSAELYDPGTGRWTATGSLHADRVGHTATLLPDGLVLVVGLGTQAEPQATAELYDPTRGKWTVTASPAKTRGYTATLLLDGRVLATGDFSNGSGAAELYIPATGS